MRQFAIIGLGRFGTSLALRLAEMGREVLVIDKSEDRIQDVSEVVTQAVKVDATDDEALKEVGIRNFDVVVVAIGEDIQASILVTLILKDLGVKCVIAKALNELHRKVLEKLGADKVIFPERDMAVRLANHLVYANVLDYIQLSPEYNIEEIIVTKRIAGKTLGELNLRAKHGLNVIAIKRRTSDEIKIAPGANDKLVEGDVVVAIGHKQALERLEEK
jgi:trk system potassium uptake protein TrkA